MIYQLPPFGPLHCERLPSPLLRPPEEPLPIQSKSPTSKEAYECGLCGFSTCSVYTLLGHFVKAHKARAGWETIADRLDPELKLREVAKLVKERVREETVGLLCLMCGRVCSTGIGLQVHISKFHNMGNR